ncbi:MULTISPECIES: hypothetical protein [unclassified Mesorhizobium]|uniref:hypothetical protein n=1 Tax=unclassified Mesorhizobium TaxID=325217 RepID=UPI000FD973A2|nr:MULTISPECIES: hypothetical protein [unclassified Mesorhizobium]TGQ09004.1 hypothetical protein EN862_022495 [Mesorhizobium sp. M2E.F.Ca.ET.219.01.1.1]TGT69539.1 hypothetical protein EN809_024775 [Mesorhizobium sp. M2E.F.Ca.ET.166.01.1.1]
MTETKPRKTPMSRAPRDRADVDAIGAKLFGAARWSKHRANLDREADKRRKRDHKEDGNGQG